MLTAIAGFCISSILRQSFQEFFLAGIVRFRIHIDEARADWNDFVPSVIDGTGELVPNIDAQPAAVGKDAVALLPYQIQIVDVIFIVVVEPDLGFVTVIFRLPIRRRGDDKLMDLSINVLMFLLSPKIISCLVILRPFRSFLPQRGTRNCMRARAAVAPRFRSGRSQN
ncbi:MAG: hypothetical protein J6Z82_08805 [Schwartzia sp.]|nr:hypothetical protein [Schwartzia sp. (in: firmicutes)]